MNIGLNNSFTNVSSSYRLRGAGIICIKTLIILDNEIIIKGIGYRENYHEVVITMRWYGFVLLL